MRGLLLSCLVVVLFGCAGSLLAADRPNIIVILSDDMGYSDIGCFGSEIETPVLDSLAEGGLRFTQFYNAARCCPSRASILTGLYPHQAGVGHMTEDAGTPAYAGNLNRQCVTIAEVLGTAGYKNYAVGKWHVTPHPNQKQYEAGTIDRSNWPLQRGFDRHYGTILGAGSFFDPCTLADGNKLVPPGSPDYYYTDAIGDHAVQYIAEHEGDDPMFMYVAFTAAHWPMHARARDIAKYKGKYAEGWDKLREQRYARMQELGVIDESTELSPHHRPWEEIDHQDWFAQRQEVYAAMVDSMDQNIGRIVDALKQTGKFDNTLIVYLQDNGGCQEEMGSNGNPRNVGENQTDAKPPGPEDLQWDMVPLFTRDGKPVRNGFGVEPGPADTYIAYGIEWANASNTPFRLYKHFVHEGGIATPLIAHWPKGIARKGEIEHQPGHLIDIMATCVDLAEAQYPSKFHDGQSITPAEGTSLTPAFAGDNIDRKYPLFWEHEGNRAIRDGDWKLVARGKKGKWELYNLAKDRAELHNLAEENPEKLNELRQKYEAWGERCGIYPLTPYWPNR